MIQSNKTELIDHLLTRLKQLNLPEPETEYEFHPTRKWRFDGAWPDLRIAFEVDGGTWSGGRHVRGAGFEKDCIKLNTATEMGWRVFRFTSSMVKSDEAAFLMERVVNGCKMEREVSNDQ